MTTASLGLDHSCVLRKYELQMRQQPVQARMCGVGEKSDRRPVDPTPIIQLKVIDTDADPLRRPDSGPHGMTYMQNPYYFLFACLVGDEDNELHVIDDGKTRFLTGTPVSSLYHLKDLDNSDAAFFVFPDLGVRKEGRYRLKLTLFEIIEQEVYYCTTTFTDTFSVFSAKKFPGMQRATDLSRSFAEQGLKIRVRKDVRKPTVKPKRKSTAQDSESESIPETKRARPHHSAEPRSYQPEYPYPPQPSYFYNTHGGAQPMPPPPVPYDPYRQQPAATYSFRGQPQPQPQPHPHPHPQHPPPRHSVARHSLPAGYPRAMPPGGGSTHGPHDYHAWQHQERSRAHASGARPITPDMHGQSRDYRRRSPAYSSPPPPPPAQQTSSSSTSVRSPRRSGRQDPLPGYRSTDGAKSPPSWRMSPNHRHSALPPLNIPPHTLSNGPDGRDVNPGMNGSDSTASPVSGGVRPNGGGKPANRMGLGHLMD
ncbi:velvet factor-domain-containing protein [Kockovaella imperatae]|uniref:Velvet factor-domain-containing protein n=1 Tax=Kockovaella imperatae TaxID=4999 RepID=A0A1Y1UF10_9TREE|nr:velvet factor-domain-containing protein [Kockovaella imperatae]ORX36096.1 velvet factor-domain-containing protein [Kockovaella imperatae]